MCPVPAQVTHLRVSNQGSTDALQVRWDGAVGDVDLYRVLLIHDSVVMKNESVPPNVSSYHFQGLRCGALYRTVVTTVLRSALSRQTVADGRTGALTHSHTHTRGKTLNAVLMRLTSQKFLQNVSEVFLKDDTGTLNFTHSLIWSCRNAPGIFRKP